MPARRLPIGAGVAAIAALAAPTTAFVAPAGIASTSRKRTTSLSASSGGGGITFFLSPSALTHLSYLDGPDVPPPVYASTLTSDDDETDVNANDDVASSAVTAVAPTSSSSGRPSLSTIISAKLPALAVGLVAAVAVGYGGGHVLKDALHLDLLGLDPLLYFLGFSVGWQAMGGDMEVEMEVEMDMDSAVGTSNQEVTSTTKSNIVDDDESIQYVMDRPIRLRRILETLEASDARIIRAPTTDQGRDLTKANKFLKSAHTQKYIDKLRKSCDSVPPNKIKRLSNGSSRTYVDSTSFDAAVEAVQDWIDAVDYALGNDSPAFALTRPPSHHACPTRGMGGCLLNGCAVAAYYALKTYPEELRAHFGNKVVFGLEGGYCWAGGSTVLGDSILELSQAWED